FFQAEDGIRDLYVTGVQTCALPISGCRRSWPARTGKRRAICTPPAFASCRRVTRKAPSGRRGHCRPGPSRTSGTRNKHSATFVRSEERRVGKECRCWRSLYVENKRK